MKDSLNVLNYKYNLYKKSKYDFCLGYLKDSLNVLKLQNKFIWKIVTKFRKLEGLFKSFKIIKTIFMKNSD